MLAAESWFGYGRWGAPYCFIGMESGGADKHGSYVRRTATFLTSPSRRGAVLVTPLLVLLGFPFCAFLQFCYDARIGEGCRVAEHAAFGDVA